ncbi:hypothetical protein [Gudongella sp. DL1XJH-153]|uniref:hypothetical protein n=1 Tax=Gudongella sp. DL1XJH-153 TaxID=3409804 RepID=UPI003BB4DC3E
MYLVAELRNGRKILFQGQKELDEYLKLNALYDQVEQIIEIDKYEYRDIMKEMVENIRVNRQ